MTLTGEQIRAARALARIEQAELARRSGLSLETIKRLERLRGPINANIRTLTALEEAFRLSGISFELDGSGQLGVRMLGKDAPSPAPQPQRPTANDPRPPLYRLIYRSTAEPDVAGAIWGFLDEIQAESTERNAALDVTGALMACNGRFLQALEGPKAAVHQVYGDISTDPRHHSLNIVQSGPVGARRFADWTLCCGLFPADGDLFALEPSMAEGFHPEALSPSGALGLLSIVSDLQREAPRSRRGRPGECPLAAECMDRLCAASAGRRGGSSSGETSAR